MLAVSLMYMIFPLGANTNIKPSKVCNFKIRTRINNRILGTFWVFEEDWKFDKIQISKSKFPNSHIKILTSKFKFQNSYFRIWVSKCETQILKFEFQNLNSKIQNSNFKIQISEFKFLNSNFNKHFKIQFWSLNTEVGIL